LDEGIGLGVGGFVMSVVGKSGPSAECVAREVVGSVRGG